GRLQVVVDHVDPTHAPFVDVEHLESIADPVSDGDLARHAGPPFPPRFPADPSLLTRSARPGGFSPNRDTPADPRRVCRPHLVYRRPRRFIRTANRGGGFAILQRGVDSIRRRVPVAAAGTGRTLGIGAVRSASPNWRSQRRR